MTWMLTWLYSIHFSGVKSNVISIRSMIESNVESKKKVADRLKAPRTKSVATGE